MYQTLFSTLHQAPSVPDSNSFFHPPTPLTGTMYVDTLESFAKASEALYESDPAATRFSFKCVVLGRFKRCNELN